MLATRRAHLAGCSGALGDPFMRQVARNLTDPFDGSLMGKPYVFMGRDSCFSSDSRRILQDAGGQPVRLPARSPYLNAYSVGSHLSLESQSLVRIIFLGQMSLRRARMVNILGRTPNMPQGQNLRPTTKARAFQPRKSSRFSREQEQSPRIWPPSALPSAWQM